MDDELQFSLVWTVVLSALSIASSIVASTLSGIAASEGFSYQCYSTYLYELCNARHISLYLLYRNIHQIV
jgi:hypothetical protein